MHVQRNTTIFEVTGKTTLRINTLMNKVIRKQNIVLYNIMLY